MRLPVLLFLVAGLTLGATPALAAKKKGPGAPTPSVPAGGARREGRRRRGRAGRRGGGRGDPLDRSRHLGLGPGPLVERTPGVPVRALAAGPHPRGDDGASFHAPHATWPT